MSLIGFVWVAPEKDPFGGAESLIIFFTHPTLPLLFVCCTHAHGWVLVQSYSEYGGMLKMDMQGRLASNLCLGVNFSHCWLPGGLRVQAIQFHMQVVDYPLCLST